MTLDLLEPSGSVVRWAALLGPAAALAERIADTDFVPKAMRGNPAMVTAAILYGDKIDIGPMQALNSIHVVEGRPGPSAELMRAMILRAGHYFTVHEATGMRVRVSGLRTGRPEQERVSVEWTLDMARAAGLMGRKNWQTHPRAMLMARATGDLGRWLFPDVIKGLGYVAEETALEPPEIADEPGAPAVPRKALQRARKPRSKPEPVPPHVAIPEPPPERHDYAPDDDPLPDGPQPESPPPEPPEPGLPESLQIGSGMFRLLQASLTRELGTAGTREERLAMLSAILGRPIESSKMMTPADGTKALDALGKIASGAYAWAFAPESEPGSPVINVYPVDPDVPVA